MHIHPSLLKLSTPRNVSEFAIIVGIIGTCCSQIMNLSALPSIYLIYKRKSTLLFPPYPFIFGLLANFVGLTYAILTQQTVVFGSTCVTLTINMICLSVHLRYSMQRRRILKVFSALLLITLVVTGIGPAVHCGTHGTPECDAFAVAWVGVVVTIGYSLVLCGQLTTFRQVIKSKNSASISPWLTGGVLLASVMWTWYAILVSDYFYLTSAIIGDISALTQIVLLIIYPSIQSPVNVEPIPTPSDTVSPASQLEQSLNSTKADDRSTHRESNDSPISQGCS